MSRLALISDIHGNCVALDAVLADATAQGASEIVCLGDLAAGGPQPREAIRGLREVGCPTVRGNADGWLLAGLPPGRSDATRRLAEAVAWAHEQLATEDLDYLAALPPTLIIAAGDWTLLCCHGSPRAEVDALLAVTPDAELDELLADAPAADALACGHTHLQLLRCHPRGLLLNPGSVGLPLGSLAATAGGTSLPVSAEYALVEVEGGDLEVVFRRVPVDVDALAAATAVMPQSSWASDLEQRIVRWNARAVA
jgi:predicted phosphodiesterase